MRKRPIFVVFRYADWVLTQFHLTFALLVFPKCNAKVCNTRKIPKFGWVFYGYFNICYVWWVAKCGKI